MRLSGRQHTIEMVDFDWPRGLVSIDALMTMSSAQWEHIRTEITRRRQEDLARPLVRLGGSVYIKSQQTALGIAAPILSLTTGALRNIKANRNLRCICGYVGRSPNEVKQVTWRLGINHSRPLSVGCFTSAFGKRSRPPVCLKRGASHLSASYSLSRLSV